MSPGTFQRLKVNIDPAGQTAERTSHPNRTTKRQKIRMESDDCEKYPEGHKR